MKRKLFLSLVSCLFITAVATTTHLMFFVDGESKQVENVVTDHLSRVGGVITDRGLEVENISFVKTVTVRDSLESIILCDTTEKSIEGLKLYIQFLEMNLEKIEDFHKRAYTNHLRSVYNSDSYLQLAKRAEKLFLETGTMLDKASDFMATIEDGSLSEDSVLGHVYEANYSVVDLLIKSRVWLKKEMMLDKDRSYVIKSKLVDR